MVEAPGSSACRGPDPSLSLGMTAKGSQKEPGSATRNTPIARDKLAPW